MRSTLLSELTQTPPRTIVGALQRSWRGPNTAIRRDDSHMYTPETKVFGSSRGNVGIAMRTHARSCLADISRGDHPSRPSRFLPEAMVAELLQLLHVGLDGDSSAMELNLVRSIVSCERCNGLLVQQTME